MVREAAAKSAKLVLGSSWAIVFLHQGSNGERGEGTKIVIDGRSKEQENPMLTAVSTLSPVKTHNLMFAYICQQMRHKNLRNLQQVCDGLRNSLLQLVFDGSASNQREISLYLVRELLKLQVKSESVRGDALPRSLVLCPLSSLPCSISSPRRGTTYSGYRDRPERVCEGLHSHTSTRQRTAPEAMDEPSNSAWSRDSSVDV